MAINIFQPKFRTEEILAQIRECLENGWTGLGFKTIEFEEKWKEYTGLKNAHFLSSNTAGLHLVFSVFKSYYQWSDNDEVITTPITFVSTNQAILYENLKPVFADVDDGLCLDPTSVESLITNKTRAVIFVGIGGNTGQLDKIVELCKKHGLKLILDAAHMAGTKVNGVHVGHNADAVVFSFQSVKNLPTADGGMVCFKDDKHDAMVRKLSWLGISKDTYSRLNGKNYEWKYDVDQIGYKYHGNSIMAAIALVQLNYLDEDNNIRKTICARYDQNLASSNKISIVKHNIDCDSSRHLYQVRVKNRADVIAYLQKNEIYPGVHYRDNTQYKIFENAKDTCPNARVISESVLSLPLHLNLVNLDIEKVSSTLLQAVNLYS
jgi:dTDP-4-amino-4,6-dideoxygalactose transaminase